MSERWFYRLFGEVFGPVDREALRDMIDKGSLGEDDEVRLTSSSQWIPVRAMDVHADAVAVTKSHVSPPSVSDPSMSSVSPNSASDEWYSRANGFELGPFSFDELLEFARRQQLAVDDEVKLGTNGKWRRIGSIGRLMVVLPHQAPSQLSSSSVTPAKEIAVASDQRERTSVVSSHNELRESSQRAAPATAPEVDLAATYQSAYEQARTQIVQSMMAQAESTFQRAEDAAKSEIAWASATNVDPTWYGFMGGVEFGPVPFAQMFALAKNGQLKPTDFVRNGLMGQFFPSVNTPGLFSAVAAIAKATETFNLAQEQAQAAASAVVPALAALPKSATEASIRPGSETPAPTTNSTATTTRATANRASSSEMAAVTTGGTTERSRPIGHRSDPQLAVKREARAESNGVSDDGIPKAVLTRADDEQRGEAPILSKSNPTLTVSSSPEPRRVPSTGFTSSSSMTSRPGIPARPAARVSSSRRESSFSISSLFESVGDAKTLATAGIIVAVLAVFGIQFLPKGYAQEKAYFADLRKIVDDIKQKRSTQSADFGDVAKKAQDVGREIVKKIGKTATSDQPIRQCLLWAARDRMPNMLTELKKQPAQPSSAELSYIDCLRQAAKLMNLKDDGLPPAPPVPPEDAELVADNSP